jgi:nickel-dependent lactate racemase
MSEDITAGQPIRVTQGVPDMSVIVAPDVTIVHEGVEYKGGDTVTLPGPMAQGFEIDGAVTIVTP